MTTVQSAPMPQTGKSPGVCLGVDLDTQRLIDEAEEAGHPVGGVRATLEASYPRAPREVIDGAVDYARERHCQWLEAQQGRH